MSKKTYGNPPGSPAIPHGANNIIRDLWRFTKNMFGFDMPHLSAHDLPLLPAPQINEEMIAYSDSITWLGHASFFIRAGGKNILVDPFLSTRAASIQPFGSPRLRPPALTTDQLPNIDIILITHSHYDHCDRSTLKALPNKENIRVFVPAGLEGTLTRWGFTNTTPLAWHVTVGIDDVSITFVPAIHHSRRSFWDYNTSWWGGFIIASPQMRVYMAGDTAYGPIFKEMGKQYGPCDFGLVPIGGYGPEERLHFVHATPEDALRIGKDMNCKKLIGMHWGALGISTEPPTQPRERFLTGATTFGYDSLDVMTLHLGQTIIG